MMTIDTAEFRRLLGHWATGVSVVTAQAEGQPPCGLTVNAFCSVALEPPLVLVCIEHGADSHDCIAQAGAFCVNVLNDEQETIARRFADQDAKTKFQAIAWRIERTGAPVLEDALAWVDCRVRDARTAGDHTIFVGEVLAGNVCEGVPLLYYRGGYGRFCP